MHFVTSIRICTMMIEVSSEQQRSRFYFCAYRVLLLLRLLCVAILLLLLLPAAVRRCVPDGQIWCWFIESDPSVFFVFIQSRFIFDVTPWQYCVTFTASIWLPPRLLRACAEPRGTSARRRETPLASYVVDQIQPVFATSSLESPCQARLEKKCDEPAPVSIAKVFFFAVCENGPFFNLLKSCIMGALSRRDAWSMIK